MREIQRVESEKPRKVGKLSRGSLEATSDPAVNSKRLFIYDPRQKCSFLVDTGADISVLPVNTTQRYHPSDSFVYAANGTKINTYGRQRLHLSLGLRRDFSWEFTVADVQHAILGADFLSHYELLPDLRNRTLVDKVTSLKKSCAVRNVEYASISTIDHRSRFSELLREFPELTLTSIRRECKLRHKTTHVIETQGQPVSARARRLPLEKLKSVKAKFQEMLDKGDIRPSKSPWASPIHVVAKKGPEKYRVCGDFRALNERTKADRYPVPNILDFNTQLSGTSIYTTLDLEKAYYHIPVAPEDIEKTAVITPFGLFEHLTMPFGLKNAAQTFQRFMDQLLRDLEFAYVYIDDILIASHSEEEHKEHVRAVLRRLNQAGLTLNVDKCEYAKTEVTFLGYKISKKGIRPTSERVNAIREYPKPVDVEQLRRFLGMVNFYRRCIPHAADIQSRLQALITTDKKRDKTPLKWTTVAETAFNEFKEALADAATLAHPRESSPIVLSTDASNTAIGAALHQIHGNQLEPLAFFSRKLSPAESKYSTYDRELLAIFAAVKYFRTQVEGRSFTIYTDHKPLIFSLTKKSDSTSPRQSRHLEYIAQFTTDIRYSPGTQNVVADALSRIDAVTLPTTLPYDDIAQAQRQDAELQNLLRSNKTSLQLKPILLPGSEQLVFVDISTGKKRPYVPSKFREHVFHEVHRLAHPGPKSTAQMVSQRFVWPGLKRDCTKWARACVVCQKSKIGRHTKSPFGKFDEAGRFQHLHLDIVGPLPPSQGNSYVLTMIDRTSHWPEAVPINNISAANVAKILISTWIARFRVPTKITSDQGRQFESELVKQLSERLGIEKLRTTSYHPQANGKVERWHRALKASIKAYETERWAEVLPFILLGLRSAIDLDSNVSPSQLTYGSSLRLPGDFFDVKNDAKLDEQEFVKELANSIRMFASRARRHGAQPVYVPAALHTASHVFLRVGVSQKALTPPYSGPHRVIKRHDKFFDIDVDGEQRRVSIDRIKPAFLLRDEAPAPKEERKDPPKRPIRQVRINSVPTYCRYT